MKEYRALWVAKVKYANNDLREYEAILPSVIAERIKVHERIYNTKKIGMSLERINKKGAKRK